MVGEGPAMTIQLRYDEKAGRYRDCKWCGGRGCLACPGEAAKEYKRQFPDGPKPVLTVPLTRRGCQKVREYMHKEGVFE